MNLKLISLGTFLVILNACGGTDRSREIASESILIKPEKASFDQRPYSEFHIGEYIQRLNEDELITVIRDPKDEVPGGIIKLNTNSGEISSLVPNAVEARNLFWMERTQDLFYKIDSSIYSLSQQDSPVIQQIESLLLVSDFYNYQMLHTQTKNFDYVSYCLNSSNEVVSQSHMSGRVIAQWEESESQRLLIQTPLGIASAIWKDCALEFPSQVQLILPGVKAQFADLLKADEFVWISFLNPDNGSLELLRIDRSDFSFEREVVDGSDALTYVGMDSKLFRYGPKPGILYLDAWSLELKMALWDKDRWKYAKFPFRGSYGFYTSVMKQFSPSHLRIAFHSFRELTEDNQNKFENLHIFEFKLQL